MNTKYFDRAINTISKTSFFNKYWLILMLAITVAGVNYAHSVTMMFLTTFALAYFSKGSRCK